MKILVTGGCGFIGSHLVDRLVSDGHRVRVLDLLEPQVHHGRKPEYLNPGAEYRFGDVRDRVGLSRALKGIEAVYHLAGQVGVGQSMYEIARYVDHNSLGTAVLLDLLASGKTSVRKIVVASSMTIYGEGAYFCTKCGMVYPRLRPETQLKKRDWQMRCPYCGRPVAPAPTPETKPMYPSSVYASTKRSQEEMCLEIGKSYRLPAVAMRYFNVYGTRQSLSNPYTGVAAIFLSRVKNGNPPEIFEDGLQSRDFIHVSDVIEANVRALERKDADYEAINVGSGIAHSVLEVAQTVIGLCESSLKPRVLGKYRCNDIRHCVADISKMKKLLDFTPRTGFAQGMREFIGWSEGRSCNDLTSRAKRELMKRGLAK